MQSNCAYLERCATYCKHAYENKETASVWPANRVILQNKTTGAEAICHVDAANQIWVVFAGTNDTCDMMHNAKCYLHDVKAADGRAVKVHAGFFLAARSLFPDILEFIHARTLTRGRKPTINLTGHSLGGAMAAVTAFCLIYEVKCPPTQIRVVTLGCPRLGNAAFAHALSSRLDIFGCVRLTLPADPVVALPCHLHHVGACVVLHSGQRKQKKCKLPLTPCLTIECHHDEQHAIESYVAAIKHRGEN